MTAPQLPPKTWTGHRWIDADLGWPIDAKLILAKQETPCD